MKSYGKRLLSALLALALVLSFLPGLPMKAEAGGIFVDGLLSVVAGQEVTIETHGALSYQTTNLIFQSSGNTIATIQGYDYNDELVMDVAVCDDDYLKFFYNARGGYRFEVKVLYGQIDVSYNTANVGSEDNPTASVYEFGKKLDWLVKPTISEVYMKVGDTAVLNVSQVTEGFSARANAYKDSDFFVAQVNEDGVITARSPGTATVYMEVLFWQTNTQYFYFWVPCTVHVVEDLTMDTYWSSYYAEPDEKYFNIVGYLPDGTRDVGFTITVDGQDYSTGTGTKALVPIPADYTGNVTVSKEGYHPYELEAEYLEVSNVINMTPADVTDPVIRAVWMQTEETENRNTKYQTIQVIEGNKAEFDISCDILWNGHGEATLYLQQGSVMLPLSGKHDRVALGQYFTADGGQVYLYALTNDGLVVSVPLLVNVAAPVTFMEMSYGDSVSTLVDDSVTGLGGQSVAYDMFSTVPVKFEIASDGTVRGMIGVKFSGSTDKDMDFYDYQNEIRQLVKESDAAEKSGDKKKEASLKKKIDKTLKKQNAYLENRKVGFGFSADVSYMGYFDGVLDNDNGLVVTEVGVIALVNVSATDTHNFFIGRVPAEWKLKFSDELELVVGGLASGSDGKLVLRVPEFSNKISVTGAVRAHILDVLGVAISLQGNFTFDYPKEADSFADGTWSVDSNFTVVGDVAGLELDLLKLDSIDGLVIWPETLMNASAAKYPMMPAAQGSASRSSRNIQDTLEQSLETALAVRVDINAGSAPQLVRLEDMDVLVWTEKLSDRAEEDQSCLYYAVRSHETGIWSEAAPVYDNGIPDFAPKLMQVGEELYVVWLKASGSLEGVTEMTDILTSRDVYAARFDAESGVFQAGEPVHEPDDSMDLLPQLQIRSGGPEAVWVRVDGDPLDPEAAASILHATYSEETGWQSQTAAEVPGIPDSLAFGEDGSIYYTLNGRLYSVIDGVTAAMTQENVYARAAKLCRGTLYWLEDDVVTDGTVRIPVKGIIDDFQMHISPDGNRKAVVFYADNENGQQIYATYGRGNSWGEPLAVMNVSDAFHTGLTGYYDNSGDVCLAVNRLKTHSNGSQVAYLRLLTLESRQDLQVTGVEYLGVSMREGSDLQVDVFITNQGTDPLDTVMLQIMEGETVARENAVNVGLLPGQSGSVELMIPMELAAGESITVTAQPVGNDDAFPENNTAVLELRPSDISVEYVTLDTLPDGTVRLSAMIINRGMTDLENIHVVFTKGTSDGEILDATDVDDAAVGQVIPMSMELSGLSQGDLVYVTVMLDEEENYISNNTAFAQVCPVITETATVMSREEVENQQLELDIYYGFSAEENEETQTAYGSVGVYTPEETGFYLVILNSTHPRSTPNGYIGMENTADYYVDRKRVAYEAEEMPDGSWSELAIYSVYLEEGVSYTVGIDARKESLVTVRLETAPAVTEIHIDDHTMYLGEDLVWDLENIYRLGLVTFGPEMSQDLLTFTSSDEAVVTVDEYGNITTYGVGTAVITATGQVYGLEESFTITVQEPEYGEPLVLGENEVTLGWEQPLETKQFTAPETGYYQFVWEDGYGFAMLESDGIYEYYDPVALPLRAGEAYTCFFDYDTNLTIRKVEHQGDLRMEEDMSCSGDDCENVLLYRFVPEEDQLLNLRFRGSGSVLKIFDERFELLHRKETNGSYWYSSGTLTAVMDAGKTYYIALEHSEEAELYASWVTMELYYYGAVFVGDTVELEPSFPNGGYDEEGSFNWSSSDPSVARVDQNGVVEFLKEGDVTITVTTADGLLRAEKAFYAVASKDIYLDQQENTTLDNQSIIATRMVFVPEAEGDYLFSIRYQEEPCDEYWMYEFELTDEDGNYLETLHYEYIRGKGSNCSLHLEAGQTCVLTLVYTADSEEKCPVEMSFLVSEVDCDTNGHTLAAGQGWDPGCEYTGMTAGEHCQVCGYVRVPQEEIPALGHDYEDGICTRCGENEFGEIVEDKEVVRLAGSHRWATALMVAEEMRENLGMEKFDAIIIASGNDFADALAGSYLSTVKNAPILLAWGKGAGFEYLDADNISYIRENLTSGGTVYILGGKTAVPELYEEALEDYQVVRLGGGNRFETNLLILEEAGVNPGDEILVCTSTNFADSLSASATGKPILLVFNEFGDLFGTQPDYLASLDGCTFTIIGGESAVSQKLADAVGEYGTVTRLAGNNRFETSVMVAQEYFDVPESAVLAYAWNYPDGLCGGSLAYSMNAPLILTMTGFETTAVAYAAEMGVEDGVVLGGTGLISDAAVRAIFQLDGDDEIVVK